MCHTVYMTIFKLPDFVTEIELCHSDSRDRPFQYAYTVIEHCYLNKPKYSRKHCNYILCLYRSSLF